MADGRLAAPRHAKSRVSPRPSSDAQPRDPRCVAAHAVESRQHSHPSFAHFPNKVGGGFQISAKLLSVPSKTRAPGCASPPPRRSSDRRVSTPRGLGWLSLARALVGRAQSWAELRRDDVDRTAIPHLEAGRSGPAWNEDLVSYLGDLRKQVRLTLNRHASAPKCELPSPRVRWLV